MVCHDAPLLPSKASSSPHYQWHRTPIFNGSCIGQIKNLDMVLSTRCLQHSSHKVPILKLIAVFPRGRESRGTRCGRAVGLAKRAELGEAGISVVTRSVPCGIASPAPFLLALVPRRPPSWRATRCWRSSGAAHSGPSDASSASRTKRCCCYFSQCVLRRRRGVQKPFGALAFFLCRGSCSAPAALHAGVRPLWCRSTSSLRKHASRWHTACARTPSRSATCPPITITSPRGGAPRLDLRR